ncbi:MAG: flagellar biosynthetic protein FliR, partial [Bryobacteraceae bacterium]
SDADSGVLLVLAQIASWLLFFAFGLDGHVIRALARSLEAYPAGQFVISGQAQAAVLALGATLFSTALRLALPIVAMLHLVDVTFDLLGKLNAQLQLITMAFPIKMLAALAMLAATFTVFPRLYESMAQDTVAVLATATGGAHVR